MLKKRNPVQGRMYQIYVAESQQGYRKSEYLVWEGYGIHKPWEIFSVYTRLYPQGCLTLYVYKDDTGTLEQLAQYWHGEIEYI